MIKKLEICWLVAFLAGILMLLLSPWFYRIWIGEAVDISWSLSIAVLLYNLGMALGAIYMHIINGIGTIRIQLITYVVLALLAWPMFILGGRYLGLPGVLMLPSIAWIAQAVLGKIQINKLLRGTTGIWCK